MESIRTIAVADDDEAVRCALDSLIRSLGHRAVLFSDAISLLAQLPTLRPDCLVADIHMPGITGLELLRQLRAEGTDLPVIIMTAFGDKQLHDQAMGLGALGFLAKPFIADDMIQLLDQALPS